MAHRAFVFAICSFLALLIGCSGYAVTVNEQTVHTPSPTVAVALDQIPDRNLLNCIEQTLSDKRILDPAQLFVLVCTNAGIASLAGLQQFSNLRQLDLSNNELTRVEVLYKLPRLSYVDLEDNPELSCADVKTLAALPREGLEVKQPSHCR
jgi:hypothetical protein